MLSLDDDDYELLGFGSERLYEELAAVVESTREKSRAYFREYDKTPERREALRVAWNRYAKSAKGKAATARRDAKRREGTYFADYYKANAEKVKARAKAYYWKKKNDPAFRAKKAAADKARYERNKRKAP